MARYSHLYSIGYSITSETEDGSDITPEQHAAAIYARVKDSLDSGEMHEAVGVPLESDPVD